MDNVLRTCRGCGKSIIMAKTLEGKWVPLDARPPVYSYVQVGSEMQAQRLENAAVSHFATCPKANDFSGSKVKKL